MSTVACIFSLFFLVAVDNTHLTPTIRFHLLLRSLPPLSPLSLLLFLHFLSLFLFLAQKLLPLLLLLFLDFLEVLLPLLSSLVEELPLDLLTTLLFNEDPLL